MSSAHSAAAGFRRESAQVIDPSTPDRDAEERENGVAATARPSPAPALKRLASLPIFPCPSALSADFCHPLPHCRRVFAIMYIGLPRDKAVSTERGADGVP